MATPTSTHPTSRRAPVPRAELTSVDVELVRGSAPRLQGVGAADLERIATRLHDRLARDPAARTALLSDPVGLLRATAPDSPKALLNAAAAAHASAPALPRVPIRVDIAGRLPRPGLRLPVQATAQSPLAGFDACLAVGEGALGRALADLLSPFLAAALANLVPPNGAFSLGLTDVTVVPSAAIDAATGRAHLSVTATVELVLAGGDPIPGLTAEIGIDVAITAGEEGVAIDQTGVEVTLLGLPAPLVSLLLQAILDLISGAVRGVFPRVTPVDLPGGSQATCDIGLRDVAVALLPGQSGVSEPCLAVLTSLLADAEGDIAALRSPLPAGRDGGVFLDNVFLLRSIACEVQHSPQLPGLPQPTHQASRTDPVPFVAWTGLELEQEVGEETIEIRSLTVAIDGANPLAKAFVVTADLTVKRRLFEADVALRIPVTLDLVGGAIAPRVGTPTYDVRVRLTPLGVIAAIGLGVILTAIGALVGALIAGIVATIAGGVVGAGATAALVLLIVAAIKRKIGSAIEAAAAQPVAPTQVIPPPIVELFGRLDVADLVFDDLELLGTLVPVAKGISVRSTVLNRTDQIVGSGPGGTVVNLSTTVQFTISQQRLQQPVTHRWRLDGQNLTPQSRPPGIATVTIDPRACTLTSTSGADVDAEVTAVATDRFGASFTASTPLHLTGHLTVPAEDLTGPKPDPLFPEQP